MNILVLFGSSSDASVYEPLCEKLRNARHHVDFEVISAHRNPDRLAEKLAGDNFDVVVAGAGLSAHLPGVVASKVRQPVFGVPVAAQFQGLDAVMSIQMMPRGVPVLCCGTSQEGAIISLLAQVQGYVWNQTLDVVIKEEYEQEGFFQKEFGRLSVYAQENGIALTLTNTVRAGVPTIAFVHTQEEISSSPFVISVPLLDAASRALPQTALTCFSWTQQGAIWAGVNNSINALIFFTKLLGASS